jgi:hypothetical protein
VTTGTGVELTQLLLKSDAAGRLLDNQNRLIDSFGNLVDADGFYVDASGQRLPESATPVTGGPPVRLSGGTLNGGDVRITAAANVMLSGQIGELQLSGNRLVSGTTAVMVRSAGDLTLTGRVQAEGRVDLRSGGAFNLTESGLVTGGTYTQMLGAGVQLAGYVADRQLLIVNSRQHVDVTAVRW